MLSVTRCSFDEKLHLTKPTDVESFTEHNIQYFDNDGFELCGLEYEFYRSNNVELNNVLNHRCNQKVWFVCNDNCFKLDHSLILQRWDFQENARDQLDQFRNKFPQLNKYLKIVPKWGIDFALDYYYNDTFLEVIHVETDYRNYEEALEAKTFFESKILNTDWKDFVKSILSHEDQWNTLTGFQQNDWKAVHWGLQKAEITEKAYA